MWTTVMLAMTDALLDRLPAGVTRAAHRIQHETLRCSMLGAHLLLRAVRPPVAPPSPAAIRALQARYSELLARDVEQAHQGLYPRQLLFRFPARSFARRLPRLFAELPRVLRRARDNRYQDLPEVGQLQQYPAYYRRNFHWQTDGYLSRRSAELYDASVELLFLGTADVMRRQIVPPVTRYLAARRAQVARGGEVRPARVLDVGTGTGSALLQLAPSHPDARYYALDLSPYYLQVAQERLRDFPSVSFVAENAERMPFVDGYFDVVTSVFLFHELPVTARKRVLEEMWRVLRPGGCLVLEDAAQLADAPELEPFLANFAREMHEPFFADYVRRDLAAAAAAAGFVVEECTPAFLSRVIAARRPHSSG
jgi:SAM-dependent methyltransferase